MAREILGAAAHEVCLMVRSLDLEAFERLAYAGL